MNKPLRWDQINSIYIPEKSGVYAWYYKYDISIAEIRILESQIDLAKNNSEKRALIEAFFKRVIFEKFDEEPYETKLSGKLKPNYSGKLFQDFKLAKSFVNTVLEDPKTIYLIREELKKIDLSFSSPLYIGMAQNLLSRVLQHRDGIIEAVSNRKDGDELYEELEENSFAKRFSNRNLKSTNLYIAFKVIESENKIHSPMEYILNRINYPLLGRN